MTAINTDTYKEHLVLRTEMTAKAADQQPLLDDRDEVTLLDEMSVVLMGHHGVGKNTVGNAILKKNAFRSKDSSKDYYLKHENTTFGRHIIVTRVPGWHADLNSEKNFQHWQVIKDSLRSVKEKPHVIILVVDMNTKPADKTKEKLKQLLGVQFVKKNRNELIERIVAVKPIADDLFPIIGSHKYEKILQAPTEYDQKRLLYDITEKGGTKSQYAFYKSLLKHEEYLVEDLEEKLSK
ncbi:immune-associated nucleotide-binding protein 11-like [Tachysurus ichikawai]